MRVLTLLAGCCVVVLAVAGCSSDAQDRVVLPPPTSNDPRVDVDHNEIEAQPDGPDGGNIVGFSTNRPLRVRVTRDGVPVSGVTVFWGVKEGHIYPTTSETDLQGFAIANEWRLGMTPGQQIAWGGLGDSESSKRAYFTATASAAP